MSVVAVKVDEEKIEVAADSICIRDWQSMRTDQMCKLMDINQMMIGGVGLAQDNSLMFRFAQTHMPESSTEKDILAFMVEFMAWRKTYTSSALENSYVLVFDNRAWRIDEMLICEVTNYDAIGAGRDFANAVMHLGHSAQEAVKVACELSCYVAEPIVHFTLFKKDEEA